ncbi:UDP-N-acetylmuramate dehydrogenase [Modestobacter sp. I12A-02628]|uniref:UDP-N-acetylenolpyruvoylglucosamine reductase n=1 Tax=Goekera deserti TaxID=2497753 RepID=A0A7K3W8T4_9ACTN|nr:UDP-N-acetylmuramate dehydrogenase [Goekera deserti]MPR00469.1 UDP-N-acetylmuramate dehydrogenase [Goekera deserti]NDI49133.1 UDP-N-acetylmuramate dehydrogenase [Goekera deserti]NEL52871.1 UDP-N-acetylmuramate dehydrogenase [Goekera deserti]
MPVRSDVSLADLTTLGVGGPVGHLVEVADAASLVAAVRAADDAGRPLLLLGGGSNLVAPDAGWPGDVVLVRSRGVHQVPGPLPAPAGATAGSDAGPVDAGAVLLEVQAGEPWDDLVAETVRRGLAGVEALSGIPGSTGATPVQNVGAYGQEVSQTIVAVRVFDRTAGTEQVLTPADCGFAYRDSRLKQQPGRYVVLTVTFALQPGPLSAPVGYAELARRLGVQVGERAPLEQVREAVLGLRRGKGMVWDPADPDSRSAGSFFTNPVVADAVAAAVPDCPSWPAGAGRRKLSAGWLVEHAGFGRGTREGRVGTSSRHSLALTTEPGATAAELIAFAARVVTAVEQRFGVTLVPEPTVLGQGGPGGSHRGQAPSPR